MGDQGEGRENRFPGRVDHQDVVHPTVVAQRDGKGGFDAEPDKGGAVQARLRGHGVDPGLEQGAVQDHELFVTPGHLFGQVDPFQQQFRASGVPGVGEDDPAIVLLDLEQGAPVQVQHSQDLPQAVTDDLVQFLGLGLEDTGRDRRQQPLDRTIGNHTVGRREGRLAQG